MRDIPAPPPGFTLEPKKLPPPPAGFEIEATGDVVDGDTLRTSDGETARLWGVDAFEAKQQGMNRARELVPIGSQATTAFDEVIQPNSLLIDSGLPATWGRPVVGVETNGLDAGLSMIEQGFGLATPKYLQANPEQLAQYKEAERLSRLNNRGGHALAVANPDDWRKARGVPDEGDYTARFADDRTPFAGMRPEEEQEYIDLTLNPEATADDLVNWVAAKGYKIDPDEAKEFIKRRNAGAAVPEGVRYQEALPTPLIDSGRGEVGALELGTGDTAFFGMLDEVGAVADSVGLTPDRENVFNSDRRFGDILWNNIDQNRAIIGFDEANYPKSRFAGQIAGAFALPYATAARTPTQLARIGALEGGAYAFGAGEGGIVDRAKNVPVGAGIGATGGFVLGKGAELAAPYAKRAFEAARDKVARGRGPDSSVVDDAIMEGADIASEAVPDELPNVPPPPDGFTIQQPANIASTTGLTPAPSVRSELLSSTRPLLAPITDAERAAAIQSVRPDDLLPIPSNRVDGVEEAAQIQAGRFEPLKVFDEKALLETNAFRSRANPENILPTKGPIDLVSFVRQRGGLQDQGGDLAAMGMDNGRRNLDFAQNDTRMGPLIAENGNRLDDMAQEAWEAGYFPDHTTRPSVDEFLEAMGETYSGGPGRRFLQDDFEQVDAFNAQQRLNNDIGKAAEDGAPMVTDRAEPIGVDDIESLPAQAYEEVPQAGEGFAGNINLSKIDSRQDLTRLLRKTSEVLRGGDDARRGVITHEETADLAKALGMTPQELLRRKRGEAYNAEQLRAARDIVVTSGEQTLRLARKAKGGSDADKAALDKAVLLHAALSEQVMGATAEAARATSQLRSLADGSSIPDALIRKFALSPGARERSEDIADLIIEHADNPGAVSEIARDSLNPSISDKVFSLWYSARLSGPHTHARNILGNSANMLANLGEHGGAAVLGAGRSVLKKALGKGGVSDKVLFREVAARLYGLKEGARAGLPLAAKAFKSGQASDFVSKVELDDRAGFSGKAGMVLEAPLRALLAEDEVAKGVARLSDLGGMAWRQASKEGLTGDALAKRAEELTVNPTQKMKEDAADYAREMTFQEPLGDIGQALQDLRNSKPKDSFATRRMRDFIRLQLPFVRTPINLMRSSLRRSPAGIASNRNLQDFKAGGAKRDLAIARVGMGTGITAYLADLAMDGLITGSGPENPQERADLMATGWQPNSFKVGDEYIKYQGLDPWAITAGSVASMVENRNNMSDEGWLEATRDMALGVSENLSNQTWSSGLNSAILAISQPERYGDAYLSRQANSFTTLPLASQINQTFFDKTLRDRRGDGSFGDRLQNDFYAQTPGLSQKLPARHDVFGREITREGALGPDIVSPLFTREVDSDPAVQEVGRLAKENEGVIGYPQRTVTVTKPDGSQVKEKLDATRYQEYVKTSGQYILETLQAEYPRWEKLSDAQKIDELQDIKRSARKRARAELFSGTPPLPPGFKLEQQSAPPPPPGFELVN